VLRDCLLDSMIIKRPNAVRVSILRERRKGELTVTLVGAA
jgi:hypothetical protein